MIKAAFLRVSFLLFSCAPVSKGVLYKTDEEAVADSTYVYGYAMVGTQSELLMIFENVITQEQKTYTKLWANNAIYKEHLFAFSFPDGVWRLSEIITGGGAHGGYSFFPKKEMEIKKGVGNFIGKWDVHERLMDEHQFESVQIKSEKEKTDVLMKEKYSEFDVKRTVLVNFK